jgi:hypothetical protein
MCVALGWPTIALPKSDNRVLVREETERTADKESKALGPLAARIQPVVQPIPGG